MGTKLFLKNSSGQFLKNSSGQFMYKTLPAEYTELEYIQSDTGGYAYINTLCPIYSGNSWKVEMTLAMGANWFSGYQSIYNSTLNSDTFESWINNTSNKGNLNVRYNDVALRDIVQMESGTKYNITFSYASTTIKAFVNNVLKKSTTIAKTTRDVSSVYLTIGHSIDQTTFKYYSVKLYKDDELLRHFVPAKRNDGVLGMYDLLNNTFYTNAGTGTFVAGPRIPSEYQEVEWIGSTGAQIIDPNYTIKSSNFIFEDTYEYAALTNSEACVGGLGGSGTGFEFGNTGSVFFNYRSGGGGSAYGPATPATNTKYVYRAVISNTEYSCYINGTIGQTISYSSTISGQKVWINRYYSASHQLNGKQYLIRMYDNGVLVRKLIPCYRKSDSVIGLYDTVDDEFYTNAGTGNFTKGPDVTE